MTFECKPYLSEEDRIRVAFGHVCLGIEQHKLAALFGVNSGRVAEAITAIRAAAQSPRGGVVGITKPAALATER